MLKSLVYIFIFLNISLSDAFAAQKLEAENAILNGAVVSGKSVKISNPGDSIEWKLNVGQNYPNSLEFRHSDNSTGTRVFSLSVNGNEVIPEMHVKSTGRLTRWKIHQVTVLLQAGENTIKITSINGGMSQFDYLYVRYRGSKIAKLIPSSALFDSQQFIRVTGTYFTPNTKVFFADDASQEVIYKNSKELLAKLPVKKYPNKQTKVNVRVVSGDLEVVKKNGFTYKRLLPPETYEAELATLSGCDNKGKYVQFGLAGSTIEWEIETGVVAPYLLKFKYGAIANTTLSLSVNGMEVNAEMLFKKTGKITRWKSVLATTMLNEGINTIRLTSLTDTPLTIDNMFVSLAKPNVKKAVPSKGLRDGGEMITILGSSFVPSSEVFFGETPSTNVIYINQSTLKAKQPDDPSVLKVKKVNVSVQAGSLTATKKNGFTVHPAEKPLLYSPSISKDLKPNWIWASGNPGVKTKIFRYVLAKKGDPVPSVKAFKVVKNQYSFTPAFNLDDGCDYVFYLQEKVSGSFYSPIVVSNVLVDTNYVEPALPPVNNDDLVVLNDLRNLETIENDQVDSILDSAIEVSTKSLSSEQVDSVITGLETLVTAPEVVLTSDQVKKIMESIDNLVVEDKSINQDPISEEQISAVLNVIESVKENTSMDDTNILSAYEVIDEILIQNSEGGNTPNVTESSANLIYSVSSNLVEEMSATVDSSDIGTPEAEQKFIGEHLQVLTSAHDFTNLSESPTIGDIDLGVELRLPVNEDVIQKQIQVEIVKLDVNPFEEDTVIPIVFEGSPFSNIEVRNLQTGEIIEMDGLNEPINVSLASNTKDPLQVAPGVFYYNEDNGEWEIDGITDIILSDDKQWINFKTNHLTLYVYSSFSRYLSVSDFPNIVIAEDSGEHTFSIPAEWTPLGIQYNYDDYFDYYGFFNILPYHNVTQNLAKEFKFTPKENWHGRYKTYAYVYFMKKGEVPDGSHPRLALSYFYITVTPVNDPPDAYGFPRNSATEDSIYNYTIDGRDVDGDSLTYSAVGLPSWLNLNSSTGQLSGTPRNEDVGLTNPITISISDGTDSIDMGPFVITVNNVNDAPVISGNPPTSIKEGLLYSFTPAASDVDANTTLTFNAIGLPPWLTVNSETGELHGIPGENDVGTAGPITLSVSDGIATSSLTPFSITVIRANNSPIIGGVPVTSVNEDTEYSFTPTASDPDPNTTLTFIATGLPLWLSLNTSTGRLSGTPGNDDVGITGSIVISVSDGSLSASLSPFTITVNNVNDAPVISGTPTTSVSEDTEYSFIPVASDVDVNTTLVFSATGLPAWLNINSSTGKVSGTPGNDDVGTTGLIVISVTDDSLSASLPSFSILVHNVNDAPEISGRPKTKVYEDSEYSFRPTASDIDVSDALEFSATNLPSWLSINSFTGELKGTPTNSDVGITEEITMNVSDGQVTVGLPEFKIWVFDVNDAPVLENVPLTEVNEDSEYQFSPIVTDVDLQKIRYEHEVDENTLLLLHMNDDLLTDSSQNNNSMVLSGDVVRSSSRSQYGGSSMAVKQESFDKVTTTNADIRNAENLTVETWVYLSSESKNEFSYLWWIEGEENPVHAMYYRKSLDQIVYEYRTELGWMNIQVINSGFKYDTWHHLAGVKDGNDFRFYLDGKLIGTGNKSGSLYYTATNDIHIGAGLQGVHAWTGYMDEFRFSDIVRYSNDFNPNEGKEIISTLSFSSSVLPSWLKLNSTTGLLSGTPLNEHVGLSAPITLQVTDGDLTTSLEPFSIDVKNVNDPPVVVSPISNVSIRETDALTFNVDGVIEDEDENDQVNYSSTLVDGSPLPDLIAFDANLKTFQINPVHGDVGTFEIKLNGTDLQNATISTLFSVNITADQAPVVSSAIADFTANDGELSRDIDLSNVFSDADDASSEFTFQVLSPTQSSLFTLNLINNVLSIGFEQNVSGTENVTIQVSSNGLTASTSFSVTVENKNLPPSFTNGGTVTVNEDGGSHNAVWTTDLSAGKNSEPLDELVITLSGYDSGLFVTAPALDENGVLTFTPAQDKNGSTNVHISISDGEFITEDDFVIEILSVNDAPVAQAKSLNGIINDVGTVVFDPSDFLTGLSVGPADESSQTVTYSIDSYDHPELFKSPVQISSQGLLTITPKVGGNGTSTVSIKITDNGGVERGGVDSMILEINVMVMPDLVDFITTLAIELDIKSIKITDFNQDGLADIFYKNKDNKLKLLLQDPEQ